MLRVENWIGQKFSEECQLFGNRIFDEYVPDLVVGVRTGGAIVAREIMATSVLSVNYCEAKAYRSSTRVKRAIDLKRLLQRFPRVLCDVLRNLEAWLRELKYRSRKEHSDRHVILDDEALGRVANAAKILIIDDAVDSGATLKAVKEKMAAINPDAQVKTAAVTVTFLAPLVEPDFVCFRRVLVRFPWSEDASA